MPNDTPGLDSLRPEALKAATDDEVGAAWGRAAEWYKAALEAGQDVEQLINAGAGVLGEMERREMEPAGGEGLLGAIKVVDHKTRKSIAFIGAEPSPLEAARGEPLVGPTGETFRKLYMEPLGLTRADCLLAYAEPQDQIDQQLWNARPDVVVALGKRARSLLGKRATHYLPHPGAVRQFGDKGEVGRKLKAIKRCLPFGSWVQKGDRIKFSGTPERWADVDAIDSVDGSGTYKLGAVQKQQVEIFLDGSHKKGRYLIIKDRNGSGWAIQKPPPEAVSKVKMEMHVPIAKAIQAKKVVYGVVLDPYQVDAENDWIPPGAVEDTAHEWMRKSRVIGYNHQKKADAYPVESWMIPYPEGEYEKAIRGESHRAYRQPFGTDVVHSGAWIVGTKLGPKEWAAYQRGEIDAYSIGGSGNRTPAQKSVMPEVEFIDLM